jgi:hypothetical protein
MSSDRFEMQHMRQQKFLYFMQLFRIVLFRHGSIPSPCRLKIIFVLLMKTRFPTPGYVSRRSGCKIFPGSVPYMSIKPITMSFQ